MMKAQKEASRSNDVQRMEIDEEDGEDEEYDEDKEDGRDEEDHEHGIYQDYEAEDIGNYAFLNVSIIFIAFL